MRPPRVFLKCLVALFAFVAQASAFAGFDGTSFSGYYAFPDPGTQYVNASSSSPSFSVGAGVETVFNVENLTWISANFSDTSLRISFDTNLNTVWSSASFNGLVFNLIGGGPLTFTGVGSIGGNMSGFNAGRVGLTSSGLTLDWNGLAYNDHTYVVINFATAVPEPETYAMFLAGLGAIGFVAWRRRPQG